MQCDNKKVQLGNGNTNGLIGLSTGLKQLDHFSSGLQKSKLYLLAARPAMGKTALALTIALYITLMNKHSVVYFTQGLPEKRLRQLVLSAESEIELQKISAGLLTRSQDNKLTETAKLIDASPLYIDSSTPPTIETIRSRVHQLHGQCIPEVIFVDYLQLLTGKSNHNNHKKMNEEIVTDLKNMAKELNTAVVLLSQLTKQLEERNNRHPVLDDLLVYGEITEVADLVFFIYRENYYAKKDIDRDIAEISIAKNISGYTGNFKLLYLEQFMKFVEPF